jgi:hypothetical protein
LEQLRFELVIAKTLARQMNKVKRGIEAAGRAVEHSAVIRPSGGAPPCAPPLIAEHYGKTW